MTTPPVIPLSLTKERGIKRVWFDFPSPLGGDAYACFAGIQGEGKGNSKLSAIGGKEQNEKLKNPEEYKVLGTFQGLYL